MKLRLSLYAGVALLGFAAFCSQGFAEEAAADGGEQAAAGGCVGEAGAASGGEQGGAEAGKDKKFCWPEMKSEPTSAAELEKHFDQGDPYNISKALDPQGQIGAGVQPESAQSVLDKSFGNSNPTSDLTSVSPGPFDSAGVNPTTYQSPVQNGSLTDAWGDGSQASAVSGQEIGGASAPAAMSEDMNQAYSQGRTDGFKNTVDAATYDGNYPASDVYREGTDKGAETRYTKQGYDDAGGGLANVKDDIQEPQNRAAYEQGVQDRFSDDQKAQEADRIEQAEAETKAYAASNNLSSRFTGEPGAPAENGDTAQTRSVGSPVDQTGGLLVEKASANTGYVDAAGYATPAATRDALANMPDYNQGRADILTNNVDPTINGDSAADRAYNSAVGLGADPIAVADKANENLEKSSMTQSVAASGEPASPGPWAADSSVLKPELTAAAADPSWKPLETVKPDTQWPETPAAVAAGTPDPDAAAAPAATTRPLAGSPAAPADTSAPANTRTGGTQPDSSQQNQQAQGGLNSQQMQGAMQGLMGALGQLAKGGSSAAGSAAPAAATNPAVAASAVNSQGCYYNYSNVIMCPQGTAGACTTGCAAATNGVIMCPQTCSTTGTAAVVTPDSNALYKAGLQDGQAGLVKNATYGKNSYYLAGYNAGMATRTANKSDTGIYIGDEAVLNACAANLKAMAGALDFDLQMVRTAFKKDNELTEEELDLVGDNPQYAEDLIDMKAVFDDAKREAADGSVYDADRGAADPAYRQGFMCGQELED